MSDYQSAVKVASEAVSAVKDEKLKEIAFAQVLAHILSDGKPPGGSDKIDRKKSSPQAGATRAQKKAGGTTSFLRELVDDDFFKSPQNSKTILAELANRSHHLRGSDLTAPLENLCHDKILRRKKIAPAEGKAALWHWSNW